jgi:hypothetical protein
MDNEVATIDLTGTVRDTSRFSGTIDGLGTQRRVPWSGEIVCDPKAGIVGLPDQMEDLPVADAEQLVAFNRSRLIQRGAILPSDEDYAV